MTTCPETVDVTCPSCGHEYTGTYQASVNLYLTPMTDEALRHSNEAQCPKCKTVVTLGDTLVAIPPAARARKRNR